MSRTMVVFLIAALLAVMGGVLYLAGASIKMGVNQEIRIAEEQITGNAMTLVALMQSGNIPADKLDEFVAKTNQAFTRLDQIKAEVAEMSNWRAGILGQLRRHMAAIKEVEKLNDEVREGLDEILNPWM